MSILIMNCIILQPSKKNHGTPEICDTNITTSQFQPNFHPRICQQSNSTPTTSLKLPPYVKENIIFKFTVKVRMQHSVPNQGH